METACRIEKDTLGEVQVPAHRYWGAQTERSRMNFRIGPPGSMPIEIVRAFAILKKAAALTNAGLGVLDTEIRQGIVSGVDVKGNNQSNAPKLTFSGGIDADVMDSAAGKLSLHVDLSHAGSQFFEVLNVPRLEQSAYTLLSAHIDWESADGRWNASVWGKNLSDKFYHTSRVDLLAGFGFDYNHIGTPRTFGITFGTKF